MAAYKNLSGYDGPGAQSPRVSQRDIAELLRSPGGAYLAPGTPAMLALETMVDTVGLSNTLYAIANLCSDKAEHIRSNWQDEGLAKRWDQRMRLLDTLAHKPAIRNP